MLGVGEGGGGERTERPYAGKNAKCPKNFDQDCSLVSEQKALSET